MIKVCLTMHLHSHIKYILMQRIAYAKGDVNYMKKRAPTVSMYIMNT